ncbi:MAG: NADH:ubiquinone reductase (Na(+)-transporting) subunit B [Deltaproteobacteria bacterium]|nr:NADH:ubiquinone reductase (Na(+)-transporting) subunit B [Deltaproteobacteria bacterium]
MKPLRNFLDRIHPYFMPGRKLEKLYPIYEMADTFLYTPGDVTQGDCHVRDSLDLKRLMTTVAVALGPCILMAMYNTGLQANRALLALGLSRPEGWRGDLLHTLGVGFDPACCLANFIHGALYFVPIFLVTNIVGGLCETVFSVVRKHEINEGFLVTGLLFPLTLPATIPLWQVGVGIAFGVVFGKEVFGGTGKNFLNPALTARAFLFFAYPGEISGDGVWTAVDGFSGATPLAIAAVDGLAGLSSHMNWLDAFVGTIPGSMGETSALACLLGAVILVSSGIGSWRIMFSMLAGSCFLSALLFWIGSDSNPMFGIPPHWHLVLGGLAFGMVFMATDPVSAAMTRTGQWFYGFLIGAMAIMVRTLNPAFPEGVMLSILFGNMFAPLIDYYVIQATIRRRQARCQH